MGVLQRVEGSEGRERQDSETGVWMVTTGGLGVDGLCVRLCGGREWRPHGVRRRACES